MVTGFSQMTAFRAEIGPRDRAAILPSLEDVGFIGGARVETPWGLFERHTRSLR